MTNRCRVLCAALLFAATGAAAHEGHVHADEPPPVEIRTAPRFEARGDLFEVVGVLDGDMLTVWVDRAADNAPVADGEVDIEAPGFAARAVAEAGVFRLAAGGLAAAGDHPLTLTITAGDDADLLTAVFRQPPAAVAPVAVGGMRTAWLAGGAALIALVAALVALAWRVRR